MARKRVQGNHLSTHARVLTARESRRSTARRQAKIKPILTGRHVIEYATGRCLACNCPAIRGYCW